VDIGKGCPGASGNRSAGISKQHEKADPNSRVDERVSSTFISVLAVIQAEDEKD